MLFSRLRTPFFSSESPMNVARKLFVGLAALALAIPCMASRADAFWGCCHHARPAVAYAPVVTAPVVVAQYATPATPVVVGYAPAPVAACPAPVTACPAPATTYYPPATSYYPPTTSYYPPAATAVAPAAAVAPATYAPTTSFYAPAPAVAAPAVYAAPVVAPAPVILVPWRRY